MSMKKFRVGMAAVLILGIGILFFVVNAFAQSASERLNCPSGALSIFDVQEGINVECVNALFATLTPTIGAPTDTPVPPTDTPVPPLHDDRAWHPVSADVSHEHKANPRDLDDVFGTEFYALAGGEISYPWQTFKGAGDDYPPPPPLDSGDFENDFKHEGYGWIVERDAGRGGIGGPFDQYVSDYRLQYHGILSALGSVHRFHSFGMEVRLCDEPSGVCGTLMTGGHQDFGNLMIDHVYIPLPGDNPNAVHPFSGRGKKSHFIDGNELWYTNSPHFGTADHSAHRIANYVLLFNDPWGPLNPDDPNEVTFYCPEYDCESNGSRAKLNLLIVRVTNPELDPDGNGIVDFDGYTDRYGYIVEGCSSPSTDCVPLKISGVPVGLYRLGETIGVEIEGDVSPPGEFWIRHPN